jgi:dihydrofolate reductase
VQRSLTGPEITVIIGPTATLVRRFNGKSNLGEFSGGDHVLITPAAPPVSTGAATPAPTVAITAIAVKDESIQVDHTQINGRVVFVDQALNQLAPIVTADEGKLAAIPVRDHCFIDVSPTTPVSLVGKPTATMADVRPGILITAGESIKPAPLPRSLARGEAQQHLDLFTEDVYTTKGIALFLAYRPPPALESRLPGSGVRSGRSGTYGVVRQAKTTLAAATLVATSQRKHAMGRIVVMNHVTLDGVMQGPGRLEEDTRGGFTQGGWGQRSAASDDACRRAMGERMSAGGGLAGWLFGRWTYEELLRHWNQQPDNPFAPALNNTPKYVVSATLTEPLRWPNSTLLHDNVATAVRDLKAHTPGVLAIMGSGVLIGSLMATDLIDEYLLMIHPLVLGAGRRLFGEKLVATLTLQDCSTSDAGVVIARYEPARSST